MSHWPRRPHEHLSGAGVAPRPRTCATRLLGRGSVSRAARARGTPGAAEAPPSTDPPPPPGGPAPEAESPAVQAAGGKACGGQNPSFPATDLSEARRGPPSPSPSSSPPNAAPHDRHPPHLATTAPPNSPTSSWRLVREEEGATAHSTRCPPVPFDPSSPALSRGEAVRAITEKRRCGEETRAGGEGRHPDPRLKTPLGQRKKGVEETAGERALRVVKAARRAACGDRPFASPFREEAGSWKPLKDNCPEYPTSTER